MWKKWWLFKVLGVCSWAIWIVTQPAASPTQATSRSLSPLLHFPPRIMEIMMLDSWDHVQIKWNHIGKVSCMLSVACIKKKKVDSYPRYTGIAWKQILLLLSQTLSLQSILNGASSNQPSSKWEDIIPDIRTAGVLRDKGTFCSQRGTKNQCSLLNWNKHSFIHTAVRKQNLIKGPLVTRLALRRAT